MPATARTTRHPTIQRFGCVRSKTNVAREVLARRRCGAFRKRFDAKAEVAAHGLVHTCRVGDVLSDDVPLTL